MSLVQSASRARAGLPAVRIPDGLTGQARYAAIRRARWMQEHPNNTAAAHDAAAVAGAPATSGLGAMASVAPTSAAASTSTSTGASAPAGSRAGLWLAIALVVGVLVLR